MSRTPSLRPRHKVVPARGESRRLELTLLPEDIEAIRTVASVTGETTLTAVVRDALKAYLWLVLEQQRDRRIISEARTGDDRIELMPLVRVSVLCPKEE